MELLQNELAKMGEEEDADMDFDGDEDEEPDWTFEN